MKIFWLILMVTIMLIFSTGVVAGQPDSLSRCAERTFSLPSQATEETPGVYYLGKAFDKGRLVEGYAFVHYRLGYAKPPGIGKPSSDSTCYTFLSKGTRWKTIEPYIVDTTNNQGLEDGFIRSNIAKDIEKWEKAAEHNILGSEDTSGVVNEPDFELPDGKNEVMFGNIEQSNAIAITIVWGYFSGPLPYRELIEWDQIYDQVDFDWSSSGESGKMDFENIATHELGHSVGMGDLYNSACSEQTMYGYASNGETTKSSLASGDILGISSLY